MRYRINREDFFAREEEQGTMAIMVCKTNQILHFNRAGRHIFDVCDRWVELDEFLHDLGAVNTTPAKLRRYFEEILYKLHACGLARLEEAVLPPEPQLPRNPRLEGTPGSEDPAPTPAPRRPK